jgi:hypothetical protein
MLPEISVLYEPTRTTPFSIFVTNLCSDTTINSAMFKKENFGTGKKIPASLKRQFSVVFVVVVDVAAFIIVCIFVKVL